MNFPEILIGADLHVLYFHHLVPLFTVILFFMCDHFVWWEELVSGVECSCWLLYFRVLLSLCLQVTIIFRSVLQPQCIGLLLLVTEFLCKFHIICNKLAIILTVDSLLNRSVSLIYLLVIPSVIML